MSRHHLIAEVAASILKSCSFYRFRRQILTEGLFTPCLIKISFKWSFYCSQSAKIDIPSFRKGQMSLKCPKTVSGSKRPTGENLAAKTAPAFLQNFRASRSARHSAFKELYWPLQGGTACFGRSFGTFCAHFRAAERVTRAVFLAL